MKKFKLVKPFIGQEPLRLLIGFATTALILTVIQPPISLSALAWVSLVPLILACSPGAKPKSLALVAYIVSLCYWLGNLYWVCPITIPGWAAFCAYTAVLWPIVALCLRYCRMKRIPLFLATGVLFVGAERLQGVFLGGFFWRFLAHSQYHNITVIQIADIFGAAGVSFLIAMVNGLLAELILNARCSIRGSLKSEGFGDGLLQRRIFTTSNLVKTAVVCAAVFAAVAYGRWRINQSDEYIETGPIVASLQSNVPQSIKRGGQASDVIFEELLQKSKASAQAGAELIVWPETMVQAILDEEVWPFLVSPDNSQAFERILREHAKKQSCFILVGAYGAKIQQDADSTLSLARYNSAFLFHPDGQKDPKRYDKIHLVLFGEVLPFRKSCRLLYNLLMKFNPLGYDHSLDAGDEYTVFGMTRGQPEETKDYYFSVIICYEATVPAVVRRFTLDKQGQKQIDWLVNISNDGWFVRFKGDLAGPQADIEVSPSAELPQHAAVCVFRAVENRLAVLRSVNTGISCLIDSLGRIRNGYIAASADLPATAMDRKGMAGWFVDKMPIDKRTTLFSKYGQWLDFCCAACLLVLIIVSLSARFFKTDKRTAHLSGLTNEQHA